MMRNAIVATLLLLVSSSMALAQADPTIGIYEDQEYVHCYGDIEIYIGKDVYVTVYLPQEIDGMTACEFRVDNLPESGALGIRTDTWTTDLVIGEPGWGIALAWSTVQPGPWILVGTLNFFMIDPSWIGIDHVMTVDVSNDSGVLVIVDDEYNTIDAVGGMYTFNCSDPDNCNCFGIPSTTEDSNWGAIKALY